MGADAVATDADGADAVSADTDAVFADWGVARNR